MLVDIKNKILKNVEDNISKFSDVNLGTIEFLINSEMLRCAKEEYLDISDRKKLFEEVKDEICGFGKIEKYLKDPTISEIMINGTESLFVERSGLIQKENEKFEKIDLEIIIQKIVSAVNKSISIASPIVDARLKDGSRVNIVLDTIALNGPIITIRKFSKKLLDISDLIKNETINCEVARYLESCVKMKKNIFISGGTGSGKTTLLNILSNFISKDERVITIEDSAELQINGIENIVRLEARNSNIEGNGKIDIRDLIITSLRMRPDRIIVGEVRGKETFDMLQAMNTGHSGSLSTGHANSSKDMLTRLESMIIMNFDIPLEAIRRQIASAIDIIIHIKRTKTGRRKLQEISEIKGYDGKYILKKVFIYDEENDEIKRIGNDK